VSDIFSAKFFTILVFSAINFAILFIIKTRTSLVISVIIAHLIAVLFFSISISNYESFREITLALIFYSMAILFLISNYGSIVVESEKKSKSKRQFISKGLIILGATFAFFLISLVVSEVDSSRDKQDFVSPNPIHTQSYDEMKKAKMRDELLDNFLFKRSSDVILIIAAASTIMLLLSTKKE
jgi:hypothetical protein